MIMEALRFQKNSLSVQCRICSRAFGSSSTGANWECYKAVFLWHYRKLPHNSKVEVKISLHIRQYSH